MSVAPTAGTAIAQFDSLLTLPKLRSLSARELLAQAARFERCEAEFLLGSSKQRKPIRISVLASASAQHLCSSLRLFLYAEGFSPAFHLGGYDAIQSSALQPDAEVWTTSPDALLLLPAISDIKSWPRMFAGAGEIDDWLRTQASPYLAIWDAAAKRVPGCRIYQSLLVQPLERTLGNMESQYPFSRSNCVRALNDYIIRNKPSHVTVIDMDALAARVGRQNWFDETGYFLSKQYVALRELPTVSAYIARLIASGRGNIKKCLVLDLDNTLWGGVVGDEGVSGIRIDPSDPVGEAFLHFQNYVLALKERGILLAVCSKNDDATARTPFSSIEDMPLKLGDFAAFVANWDDKVTNIRRIATELNIGLDSIVFFDDNPAERAIVAEYEPSVLTIDVPSDPSLYVRALDASFAFEFERLTEEDLGRTATYAQNQEREKLQSQFIDYDDYLKSLGMKAWIVPVDEAGLPRVAQLFNKTNQFNVRTVRYSEGSVAALSRDPDACVLQVKFADRFSNYGIVAGVVLKRVDEALFIDNWVMSCRVFERGLEYATLAAILAYAEAVGVTQIAGEFIPSAKNAYVSGLFERLGFVEKAGLGGDPPSAVSRIFTRPVPDIAPSHHIEVVFESGRPSPAPRMQTQQEV